MITDGGDSGGSTTPSRPAAGASDTEMLRWAQQRIATLEREVKEAKAEVVLKTTLSEELRYCARHYRIQLEATQQQLEHAEALARREDPAAAKERLSGGGHLTVVVKTLGAAVKRIQLLRKDMDLAFYAGQGPNPSRFFKSSVLHGYPQKHQREHFLRLVRAELDHTERLAAIFTIQRISRGWLSKRQRERDQLNGAALEIQRIMRGYLSRQQLWRDSVAAQVHHSVAKIGQHRARRRGAGRRR